MVGGLGVGLGLGLVLGISVCCCSGVVFLVFGLSNVDISGFSLGSGVWLLVL